MSGIFGLIRIDGETLDLALIQSLTNTLGVRGPDSQTTWQDGSVALGHALLRTGENLDADRQPLTLDGASWIVADARVDARDDLATQLDRSVETTLCAATDAELILRAYLKWGEGCVDHLLGDYAFVVWDHHARRLFCARDHMGVKPLYYAQAGPWLLISNALECIRSHPAVSDRLNDLAIADFLLFGFNQDPASTAFGDISRVPAAHTLSWSATTATRVAVHRYWTMPVEEPIRYRRERDFTDRFLELLRQAVIDRLRIDRVGIFMSGGIDSAALAATAVEVLRPSTGSSPVHAFTFVHETLIEDSERRYAELTAKHLQVPIHFYAIDDACGGSPSHDRTQEPFAAAVFGRPAERRAFGDMAAHSRVAFYGEGPDNALWYDWAPYLAHLWRQRRWGWLLRDFGRFVTHHRRVPLLPTIPRLIAGRRGRAQLEPVFPDWIPTDLVNRLDLKERWRTTQGHPDSRHPVRPVAYASLQSPLWQSMFETLEPSYTGAPLEVRHPYLDIRLLRFLLSVPVVPWCRQKHLLRSALRGTLPEPVRRRAKTPLSGSPDYERVRRYGMPAALPSERLATYGSAHKVARASPGTVASVETNLRFVALSQWLYDLV